MSFLLSARIFETVPREIVKYGKSQILHCSRHVFFFFFFSEKIWIVFFRRINLLFRFLFGCNYRFTRNCTHNTESCCIPFRQFSLVVKSCTQETTLDGHLMQVQCVYIPSCHFIMWIYINTTVLFLVFTHTVLVQTSVAVGNHQFVFYFYHFITSWMLHKEFCDF